MSPWSARSTWAVELNRNYSVLLVSLSPLMYLPLKVTPLGATQNRKAHYSNKRGTLKDMCKKHLAPAFTKAVTLQKFCKIIMPNSTWFCIFVLFCYPHLYLPTYHVHVWKPHIQPQVQLLLYSFAHRSVQSFNTHGPRTDSSETQTGCWWLCCRNTQGQDQGHAKKGSLDYMPEMPDRVKRLEIAGWIWNSAKTCMGLQRTENWTERGLSQNWEEILAVFKNFMKRRRKQD